MFNERKAAQVAAWFLRKNGGRMPHLKLMKLMYLADRDAMANYAFPITGDKMVAMPHGPVLSMTLNLINGDVESRNDGWEAWISDRENHEVALRDRPEAAKELDELSAADIDVLDRIWQKFGGMDKWQIRDYTHDHCPEWTDPQGSSTPISYAKVFEALGCSEDEAIALGNRIEEHDHIDRLFARL